MTISGYMICYNEKEIIKLSVLNLLQFVDELVITDGESTDGTMEILQAIAQETPKIKLYPMRQEAFRNKSIQNREHYSGSGFNEMERRTYAMSKCTGDYILMKDVDELYHEDINFHDLISRNPHFSYNDLLFEVISATEFLPSVRISAHHEVPRLVKNTGTLSFKPFNDTEKARKGIDCIIYDINKKVCTIDDAAGAIDRWHYKMIAAKTCYDPNKLAHRKPLPMVPKEHQEMIRLLNWFPLK